MSFTSAIKSAWKNKFDYSGRAEASEFWWFVLFSALTPLPPLVIFRLILFPMSRKDNGESLFPKAFLLLILLGILYLILATVLFILGLPILVKRLHDINQSGGFVLLGLIPIFGIIALVIMSLMPGNSRTNKYGEAISL